MPISTPTAPTSGSPRTDGEVLAAAARRASAAWSVWHTTPWRWRIAGTTLELLADRDRRLAVADPDARLLTVSCGVALHHARVAVTGAGRAVSVRRFPDPLRPDLLAVLTVTGRREPSTADRRRDAAIGIDTWHHDHEHHALPAAALERLRAAAATGGAFLRPLLGEQVAVLGVAVAEAAALRLADTAYRAEHARWSVPRRRPGQTVPGATAEPAGAEPGPRVAPGDGTDSDAVYAVLCVDTDSRAAWLRGGEALSAVLLDAAVDGVCTAVMTDVVEMPAPRDLVRDLLGGVGEPLLALRLCGTGAASTAGLTSRAVRG
ncbi:MAG TPA: nitroreductase [Micromonosporaceae bacterium]